MRGSTETLEFMRKPESRGLNVSIHEGRMYFKPWKPFTLHFKPSTLSSSCKQESERERERVRESDREIRETKAEK